MKEYSNILDLFKEVLGPDYKTVEDRIKGRKVVKELINTRVKKGLTQAEFAQLFNVTKDRIVKIEDGADSELTAEDITLYKG